MGLMLALLIFRSGRARLKAPPLTRSWASLSNDLHSTAGGQLCSVLLQWCNKKEENAEQCRTATNHPSLSRGEPPHRNDRQPEAAKDKPTPVFRPDARETN